MHNPIIKKIKESSTGTATVEQGSGRELTAELLQFFSVAVFSVPLVANRLDVPL
jgi:hypothetical protein